MLFTYVVELITEDMDAFAVVVDDVETAVVLLPRHQCMKVRQDLRCGQCKANSDTKEEG